TQHLVPDTPPARTCCRTLSPLVFIRATMHESLLKLRKFFCPKSFGLCSLRLLLFKIRVHLGPSVVRSPFGCGVAALCSCVVRPRLSRLVSIGGTHTPILLPRALVRQQCLGLFPDDGLAAGDFCLALFQRLIRNRLQIVNVV